MQKPAVTRRASASPAGARSEGREAAGKPPKMATSQIETVSTGADKAKLAAAVVLAVAAIVAFYVLSRQGALVQWAVLLVGLAAAVGTFASSENGRRLWSFGRDSWREVKKVVWPTRKESIQMTAYVFGFVVIMAIFLWLTDKTVEWVFYDLLLGWRK
jgi:preprotein translocase subunit SecE